MVKIKGGLGEKKLLIFTSSDLSEKWSASKQFEVQK